MEPFELTFLNLIFTVIPDCQGGYYIYYNGIRKVQIWPKSSLDGEDLIWFSNDDVDTNILYKLGGLIEEHYKQFP